MNKLSCISLAVLAIFSLEGCGGGGSENNLAPSEPLKIYKVKVVDDNVEGASVEALGCQNVKALKNGEYSLECATQPTYIKATGGFVDVNKNGKHDDNETSMGLPLLLNLDTKLFGDVNLSEMSITPLSTLVANIKDKKELVDLASKLGIDKNSFNKDLSSEHKELFQKLNTLLIIAQSSGINNQLLLMKKLREKIIASTQTNIGKILEEALGALKNDEELKKAYGELFLSGFIDESTTYMLRTNVLDALAEEYSDNDASQIIITGFIYDGVIADANIKILDGKKVVGTARSTSAGKWKISLLKTVLNDNKVLLFTGEAIDSNGDKILLKSAITTEYLREITKQRISSSDIIDLIITNVTTAQVAILEKNDKDFLNKPDILEEKKDEIEVFQQELLLKASAAIKSIIDGETKIATTENTYSFIINNLIVTGDANNNLELQLDGKVTDSELATQTEAIKNDAVLSQQLLTIESDKPLTNILNKPLYEISYYKNSVSSQKSYTKMLMTNNKITKQYYELKNDTWTLTYTKEHSGKVINNVFYVDEKEGIAPYAYSLKEDTIVHSVKLNKNYTFNVVGSQLYKPFKGFDIEKVGLSFFVESFDGVVEFKDLSDAKINAKLPSTYATLSFEEQQLALNTFLMNEISKESKPFNRSDTKLTSALDIAKNIDISSDVSSSLASIKTILDGASAEDKDAQVGKALFSLAEITNSETVGELISIKLNGSSIALSDNLSTLIDSSVKDKVNSLEAELLSTIIDLSDKSTSLIHDVVLKLEHINTTLGNNFADERYVFSYDDVNMTANQSKLLRASILAEASNLEYLAAFDYVNNEDIKVRTTVLNGVTAEYTNISANPLPIFSRSDVGALNATYGEARLTHAKALLLEATLILQGVIANKEELEVRQDIIDAQTEAKKIEDSLKGIKPYEVERTDYRNTIYRQTITTSINLKAFYETTTVLDMAHTVGHDFEYVKGNSYSYDYRPGNYDLAISQFYNDATSNEWVNENNGSTLPYNYFSHLPRIDLEPKNIPIGTDSHISSVISKIEIVESGYATITHTGDNILKYIFNDIDVDLYSYSTTGKNEDVRIKYEVKADRQKIPDTTVRYTADFLYGADAFEFIDLDLVAGKVTVKGKVGFTGQQCFGVLIRDSLGHKEERHECVYNY